MGRYYRRSRAYERTGGRCAYCGCKLSYPWITLDHIVPLSRFGSRRRPGNLVACCQPCNIDKGCMSIEEYRVKRGDVCFWIEMLERGHLVGVIREAAK